MVGYYWSAARGVNGRVLAVLGRLWGRLAGQGGKRRQEHQWRHRTYANRIDRKVCTSFGRRGALTPSDLYLRLIPDLVQRGKAREISRSGKQSAFAFNAEEASSNREQKDKSTPAMTPPVSAWLKRKRPTGHVEKFRLRDPNKSPT